MNVAFNAVDGYGLPIRSTTPTVFYQAGAQYSRASPVQAYVESWLVLPATQTTVTLRQGLGGNMTVGMYYGQEPAAATRGYWNVGASAARVVDVSSYPLLCDSKILWVRQYMADGYAANGMTLQWDIGSGLVNVPSAAIHGSFVHD